MKATSNKGMNAQVASGWHDAEELRWAVRHWAARIGVSAPQVEFREMRRKWASISGLGQLTLNTELIVLPKHLGEFVIVHELVHRLAQNHGRVFTSFMHAYLPDWESRASELQKRVKPEPQRCERRRNGFSRQND